MMPIELGGISPRPPPESRAASAPISAASAAATTSAAASSARRAPFPPPLSGRCSLRGRSERLVLVQDLPLELAYGRSRLDAEPLVETAPESAVALEGLCLPPRPVQGHHQLTTQPLAKRMLLHERFQLRDHASVLAPLQLRLDARLERGEAKLLEARDLVLSERLVGELGERRATPELEGGGQALEVSASDRTLQHLAVELPALDPQQVAG